MFGTIFSCGLQNICCTPVSLIYNVMVLAVHIFRHVQAHQLFYFTGPHSDDNRLIFSNLFSERSSEKYCHMLLFCKVCIRFVWLLSVVSLSPSRIHSQIYCIHTQHTTFSLPFEECAFLLFYILYINIYKAFCKWTNMAIC